MISKDTIASGNHYRITFEVNVLMNQLSIAHFLLMRIFLVALRHTGGNRYAITHKRFEVINNEVNTESTLNSLRDNNSSLSSYRLL